MKNALVLHGTDSNSKENWFEWLKIELEKKDWLVWSPDLPQSDKPNIERYNQFILNNKDWKFGKDSIIIGHSSGAVAILGLLQNLPDGIQVDSCYLVSAFKNDLDWDALNELFVTEFDFEKIKNKAKHFVFIHSDNDPYCPLEHAEFLSKNLGGELIVKKGQKHFSVSTMGKIYEKFPFLFKEIIMRQKRKEFQERISKRVDKLKSGKAQRAFKTDPKIVDVFREKDIAYISERTNQLKLLTPEVYKLIIGIRSNFDHIWDQNKFAASYLLIGKAFSNFETVINLVKNGKCLEMVEVARSGQESLDLVFLFFDKPDTYLEKWFNGEIIDNSIARKAFHDSVNEVNSEPLPVYELKNEVYKIYSLYTHSSYGAILDYIDVFREDLDFNGVSGLHYSRKYFEPIVANLLINILLALKNVYGTIGDKNSYKKVDKLLELSGHVNLSTDQIKKILHDSGL